MKPNRIFIVVPILVIAVVVTVIGVTHLLHPTWVGEQPASSGYYQKAIGLITDAPHATAELFYSTIENLVILAVGFSWGRSRWRREHEKFDQEHGVEH
jgi:hypothetical protein